MIIYLIGKPGVGKYTIAKELRVMHGFVICYNQLINNPIFELLQYDGYGDILAFGWNAISNIRKIIFAFLSEASNNNNYILTNCLADSENDRKLYEAVQNIAAIRNSLFIPVQLQITKEEHLKRLTRPERKERWKSIDPKDAEDHGASIMISHPNLLKLDISKLTSTAAAEAIIDHIEKLETIYGNTQA